MKTLLIFLALIFIFSFSQAQSGGWKQTGYSFTDATKTTENVLAGTSDYMKDVVQFKGGKGDMEISYNRYDKSSGALLAGVTYNVKWNDPQTKLFPGEKIKMHYTLKTISSKTWTPGQQMVKFSQGVYGINLANTAGEVYFKKDFNSDLISQKSVEKGYKAGDKKTLTVNLGTGFAAIYAYEWDPALIPSQIKEVTSTVTVPSGNQTGWYFTGYEFVDGSRTIERVLAGTSDYMIEVTSFKGQKGNMDISFSRKDKSSGKLLVGVTYSVKWTDPQTILLPGNKIKMHYTLKTITATSMTPDQQMAKFSQGIYGINLANTAGEVYFKKDFDSDIISQKAIEKGAKAGEKKTLTVILGTGFKAIYNYEWKVF